MNRLFALRKPLSILPWIVFLIPLCTSAGSQGSSSPRGSAEQIEKTSVRLLRAFIVDERLSPLRKEPHFQAPVVNRLRIGRQVSVITVNSKAEVRGPFIRIAATRRTRGWIHREAIIIAGRPGEDARLLRSIESTRDSIDRIRLAQLLLTHFNRSPLVPKALIAIGSEAEKAGANVMRRASQRLRGSDSAGGIPARDYFLSDTGLDRYSRIGVRFEFNEATGEYVYDGTAYELLIRRYAKSPEAEMAHKRLVVLRQRLAQR